MFASTVHICFSQMAQVETLGILEEIELLISDKFKVVSYKWLSRSFLLSSNAAKKLLQDFAEKHKSGCEAVYALSGWLKNNPSEYHVKLVPGHKLTEVKQAFENCSVQVYSVQACVPKDPASLWNTEYIQAEELYRQPPDVDNCLRDNRLCAISNSFVKRNPKGATTSIISSPQSRKAGSSGLPANDLAKQTELPRESSPKRTSHSSTVKAIKTESTEGGLERAVKPPSGRVKAPPLRHEKQKDQSNKTTSRSGASLANMWDRASAKTKSNSVIEETMHSISSDARDLHVTEADNDEDDCDVNFRRKSNGNSGRKRRVVFDFSDDEDDNEDAISLASPNPPRKKSLLDKGHDTKTSLHVKSSLDLEKQKIEGSTIVEDAISLASPKPPRKKSLLDKGHDTKTPLHVKSSLDLEKQKIEGSTIVEETAPDMKSRKSLLEKGPNTKTSLPVTSSLDLEKQKTEGSTIVEETVSDIKSSQSLTQKGPHTKKSLPVKDNMNLEKPKIEGSTIEEETGPDIKSIEPSMQCSVVERNKAKEDTSSDKMQSRIHEVSADTNDRGNTVVSSTKRRKVLQTRIDERGREVTEVVWEGDDGETKSHKDSSKNADNKTVNTNGDRPAVAKKAVPVPGNTTSDASAKAKQKKGGNAKDPKQGNMLSFFKRV